MDKSNFSSSAAIVRCWFYNTGSCSLYASFSWVALYTGLVSKLHPAWHKCSCIRQQPSRLDLSLSCWGVFSRYSLLAASPPPKASSVPSSPFIMAMQFVQLRKMSAVLSMLLCELTHLLDSCSCCCCYSITTIVANWSSIACFACIVMSILCR